VSGQRKKRSDCREPFKCNICEYKTKNKTTLKIHKLNKHLTREERKKEFTYYCDNCDFGSFSNDSYEIHLKTTKHKYNEIKNNPI